MLAAFVEAFVRPGRFCWHTYMLDDDVPNYAAQICDLCLSQ